MIQLNFLNAVVEDNGNGLRVNGKDLNSIISAALGTIKKIPGRYEYLGEENKNKPFESQLCNVSVTIDDISTEITETIVSYEAVCEVKDGVLYLYDATELERKDVSHLVE